MPHEHLNVSSASALGGGLALLLALALAVAGLYLFAVRRRQNKGLRFSRWRTASFLLGIALVVVPLAPPLAPLAHHDLPAHMFQHLLLGMLGPIGIVLGTPITLALSTLPAPVARKAVLVLHSRPLRLLSHPVSALVLNVGGMGVLYMTPLYSMMHEYPALHTLVHFHFFAAGCLFAWAILQLEPAARMRVPARTRLIVLLIAIGAHANIAKAMYAFGFPRETMHSLEQIQQAAKIMYYGGDFSELLLMILLFATWRRKRSVTARSPGARTAIA